MWIVYILKLSSGAYYTGITNNIAKRIKAHSDGKGSKFVRAHLPFIIVYIERISGRSEASKREAAIKKLSHKEKEKLIAETERW